MQTKAQNYSEIYGVNVADGWKERLRSYPGRSHGRVETAYETWSKACHEKYPRYAGAGPQPRS